MTDPDRAQQARAGVGILKFKALDIDSAADHVVYMNVASHMVRAEGLAAQTRLVVSYGGQSLIATLNVVQGALVGIDEASLSIGAQRTLQVLDGDPLAFAHVPVLASEGLIRGKVLGNRLDRAGFASIIADVLAGRLSQLHLAAFVTACAGDRMNLQEVIALTEAMVRSGERLHWTRGPVVDKHCIGGLPGNRTTPIIVAIATANGLTMPKTSSRAITSPAGTADTMEVLAPVDLDLARTRAVVDRTGGCIVWGGTSRLSPADDVLIRIARPLDLDGEGQMVASVLSKKLAAGSERVLIDLPVGPGVKVRTADAANALSERFIAVGEALGLQVKPVITDGSQPVGRGIGPALEARDLLQVLRCEANAPPDLAQRSLHLAGLVLELGGVAAEGEGATRARETLASGAAWRQFLRICEAQGGLRPVPHAPLTMPILAPRSGRVARIDNRLIARIAKLAGAPRAKAAGVDLHVALGQRVLGGEPLYTVHAEAPAELDYALAYAEAMSAAITVEAA
jgi:thymidine phosphorylase